MTSKETSQNIALIEIHVGQRVKIHRLPKGKPRAFFIRLGISEGDVVECYERLPGGTVVVKKNRQEIAVGHQLAREIHVVTLEEGKAA